MKLLSAAWIGSAWLFVALPSATAPDADRDALQGKWAVESFEYNGNPVELLKDAVREFKDGTYKLVPKSGDSIEGTVKLDATKDPKEIDLEVSGRILKGIYLLDGEMLKLSYSLTGGERPTEFVSKPDSGTTLIVHKRAK